MSERIFCLVSFIFILSPAISVSSADDASAVIHYSFDEFGKTVIAAKEPGQCANLAFNERLRLVSLLWRGAHATATTV